MKKMKKKGAIEFYGNVCPNFISTQSVVHKGHGHRTVTRTDDSSKETAFQRQQIQNSGQWTGVSLEGGRL
ncbi:hypothetical protein T4E_8993 [Trichinella pseudospiralis]|uniref:Uncharacterized protein n=1 Tax=Trichinella pseudospiralis TaxID=6337 RepID=A0A0V0YLD3_TRIPS|nr:hypothetical protein T4E_8993 [Trichinella pseudospiralis]